MTPPHAHRPEAVDSESYALLFGVVALFALLTLVALLVAR